MARTILVVNAGSSSVKLAWYEEDACVDSIQIEASSDHADFGQLNSWVASQAEKKVDAVAHRIVHGGQNFSQATEITDAVLAELRSLASLDLEHMSLALQIIEQMRELLPGARQIACFDTGFFHDLPRVAQILPLPRKYERIGVRKYGFHGLSYQSILQTIKDTHGVDVASARIVCAHLGSGASLAAIAGGEAVDTTMGMTPASGIPMSTRSGNIDPGVVEFLHQKEGIGPEEFNQIANKASGLLGISELSADMYTLLESEKDNPKAKDAVDVFCREVKKSIGSLSTVLGGLDVLVFAGGMGENAPRIRDRVCKGLEYLGIEIDADKNQTNTGRISKDDTPVGVYVVHTDEALVMIQQTNDYLNQMNKQEQ